MKTKTLYGIALVSSLGLFQAVQAAPVGSFDGPREGEIISGIINIWGWGADVNPVQSVEFGIDDRGYISQLGYAGSRKDVANAKPELFNPEYSGYAGAYQTRHLTNGPHTFRIRITNSLGEETVFERQVIVSNSPERELNTDSIDLTSASARVSGQKIFLDNVSINDRMYNNVDLEFDSYTNSYRIVKFFDDLDGDGYSDDDLNQDGYHDDDLDLNGYPDTGLDQNTDDGTSTTNGLDAEDVANLIFMREEEKLARDVYRTLDGLWGHRTFANITNAEQQHMDSIKVIMDQYGVVDPVMDDGTGIFVNSTLQNLYNELIARGSTSLVEALHAGALVEEVDIKDLWNAIDETESIDLKILYGNLVNGSYNHLKAFVGAIENLGVTYTAQLLESAEVEQILADGSTAGGPRGNGGAN